MENFYISNANEFVETLQTIDIITNCGADCHLYFTFDEDFGNKEEWDKIKHLALEFEEKVELVEVYWDINDDPYTYAKYQEVKNWHFNKEALDLLGIDYLIWR